MAGPSIKARAKRLAPPRSYRHDRLLDDFPSTDGVLPRTMVATVPIAHRGSPQVDGRFGR